MIPAMLPPLESHCDYMGAAWWGQEEREGAEGRGREVSAATDLPYVASPMRNTFPLALVAGMVAASSANAQLPRYGLSTRVELHLSFSSC